MAKPKPTIVVAWVHPGTVHNVFLESLLNLYREAKPFHIRSFSVESGPLLSKARNLIAEQVLQEDDSITHLLMVDSDMSFSPQAVRALWDAKKPIVGALYYGINRDDFSLFPVALKKHWDGAYRPIDEVPEKGLVEVDAIGMGLTLIHRDVLEDLGADATKLWPFAETVVNGRAVGEDITFCLRAKEKGHQTWLCGDARAGHAKTVNIGR